MSLHYFNVKYLYLIFFFFFFRAEDGIRDTGVTGVQTCALPICLRTAPPRFTRWEVGAAGGTGRRRHLGAVPRGSDGRPFFGPPGGAAWGSLHIWSMVPRWQVGVSHIQG